MPRLGFRVPSGNRPIASHFCASEVSINTPDHDFLFQTAARTSELFVQVTLQAHNLVQLACILQVVCMLQVTLQIHNFVQLACMLQLVRMLQVTFK